MKLNKTVLVYLNTYIFNYTIHVSEILFKICCAPEDLVTDISPT